jgi:hypothetical protein
MDRPRARELEHEPTFPALADLRRQFGVHLSDEEFLLRAVMPPEQVDAMQAAGRSRATYTPGRADARPAAQARRAAQARDIVIERPGFRLALHAGASLHDPVEGSPPACAMPPASCSTWTARSRWAMPRAAGTRPCPMPWPCWRR